MKKETCAKNAMYELGTIVNNRNMKQVRNKRNYWESYM